MIIQPVCYSTLDSLKAEAIRKKTIVIFKGATSRPLLMGSLF